MENPCITIKTPTTTGESVVNEQPWLYKEDHWLIRFVQVDEILKDEHRVFDWCNRFIKDSLIDRYGNLGMLPESIKLDFPELIDFGDDENEDARWFYTYMEIHCIWESHEFHVTLTTELF